MWPMLSRLPKVYHSLLYLEIYSQLSDEIDFIIDIETHDRCLTELLIDSPKKITQGFNWRRSENKSFKR
jgi:hypothetical protein